MFLCISEACLFVCKESQKWAGKMIVKANKYL